MPESTQQEKSHFPWQGVAAVLTALAALVTALAGLKGCFTPGRSDDQIVVKDSINKFHADERFCNSIERSISHSKNNFAEIKGDFIEESFGGKIYSSTENFFGAESTEVFQEGNSYSVRASIIVSRDVDKANAKYEQLVSSFDHCSFENHNWSKNYQYGGI